MAKEMEQNLADKNAAGITLTPEQAAAFKKFQDAQAKALRYTAKQTLMLRKAKAAGIEVSEKEIDEYMNAGKKK